VKVLNIHERVLDASIARVGELIDSLASANDRLWPIDRWIPMRFDRPLGTGAVGGHGPIRYTVESYVPGNCIQFRFSGPAGFVGVHYFETKPAKEGKVWLRHVIDMQVQGRALLLWAIIVCPLHNALMEDALDRAEEHATGKQLPKRKLSAWVRLVRWAMVRRQSRKGSKAG
jgi:hypothetical protein